MSDEVPDRLDEPMSRLAMAKLAGVGPSTLKNWSAQTDAPLKTVSSEGGGVLYTWRHLLEFCAANLDLPATRKVRERYRAQFVDPLSGPNRYFSNVGAASSTRSRPAQSEATFSDGVTIRSALEDLKAQVHQHATVAAAAAKLAEDAAKLQAALLERFELLEIAVSASAQPDG